MGRTLKQFSPSLPEVGYLIQYTNEGYVGPAELMIIGLNMIRLSRNDLWMRIV